MCWTNIETHALNEYIQSAHVHVHNVRAAKGVEKKPPKHCCTVYLSDAWLLGVPTSCSICRGGRFGVTFTISSRRVAGLAAILSGNLDNSEIPGDRLAADFRDTCDGAGDVIAFSAVDLPL